MIDTVTYNGPEPGPRLLVFGAVHGNEKCGTAGIARVIAELEAGKLKLVRGRLTLVPVCNPRAYEKDVRFTERNLNRRFVPMEKPDSYEARLCNFLCPLVVDSDAMIDLHSCTAPSPAFASVDGARKEENEFAAVLGAHALTYGWRAAYAAAAAGRPGADPDESIGTTSYARRNGVMAVLLECGQHKDPQAVEVAYRAIRNALSHLGMAEGAAGKSAAAQSIRVTQVVYRTDDGAFSGDWANFARVKVGQVVATRKSGEALKAPADGFVVLPKSDAPPGTEWFYFGVEE